MATVYPYAVNENGEIVSTDWCPPSEENTPFYWDGDKLITLELPEGTTTGDAPGINNLRQIAGWVYAPTGNSRGVVIDGDEATLIETPPDGNFNKAVGIADSGPVVVGYWGNAGTGFPKKDAFIWDEGVTTPLGAVLG